MTSTDHIAGRIHDFYQDMLKKVHQSEKSKPAGEDAPTERRVGKKAKREESDEEESDQLNPFATGFNTGYRCFI